MNSPISWKQCPGPAVSTTRHCGFLLGRSNDLQDDSFPQSSEIMSWSLATVWQLCQAPQCLLQASTLAWDARRAYFHLWAWLKFLCFLFEVKGTFLWEMILCESVPALLLTHPESISMSCLELQGGGEEVPARGWSFPPHSCARCRAWHDGSPCSVAHPARTQHTPVPDRAAQQPQLSPANALWTRCCRGDRVHIAQPPKHFPLFVATRARGAAFPHNLIPPQTRPSQRLIPETG